VAPATDGRFRFASSFFGADCPLRAAYDLSEYVLAIIIAGKQLHIPKIHAKIFALKLDIYRMVMRKYSHQRRQYMSKPLSHRLSRRERQIMDAIYTLGQASAAQVLELLPDPPSLSSVRKLILILEQRGHLSHKQEGQHFVYMPTQPRQSAARSAMRQVLSTFFGGNLETAVATLLSEADTEISQDEAARLVSLIESSLGSQGAGDDQDFSATSVSGESK
jgi:predicted transcriptional regulator